METTDNITLEWLEQFDDSAEVWRYDSGEWGVGTPDEEDAATWQGSVMEVRAELEMQKVAAGE